MRRLILSLFLLVSFQAYSLETPNDSTITLAYDAKPNPPYYYGDGVNIDWNKPGISLEEFKLVEQELGIEFKFVRRPWARALSELESHDVDGLFHASYKPAREQLGVYPKLNGVVDESKKVMAQSYYLYVRRGSSFNWDGTNLASLKGRVGAMLGYSIVNDLEALGVSIDKGSTQRSNLLKLASGRIEAVAGIEEMNDFQIKKDRESFGDIIKLEPPIKKKAYYLIFSHQFAKQKPALMASIWDAVIKVQKSEKYADILKKYVD